MAIIQLQDNQELPSRLLCMICGKQIAPNEAVAGLSNAENNQCFACNGHFWNPHQLIAGWADFMATERARRIRNEFALEYGMMPDARTLR